MCIGCIHYRGKGAIGTKIAFGGDAVHKETAALTGPGIGFYRAVGKRQFRAWQAKVSPRRRGDLPVEPWRAQCRQG